ncbi:uncharacterized protein LOC125653624 isoform X1 [Ostrea edulis]|uniref:uncharacterized protein LOC125653624 isoform X1 n=1 Tax=Ostrea edulis TaxID=37623 RepID=UPI0024AF33A1|nr:uncharacterized protein LOC125653624 isoform X1 [Ostrea edulis]
MASNSPNVVSGVLKNFTTWSISPSSNENYVPSRASCEWTHHVVDKLDIRFVKDDIFNILSSRWCLIRLSSNALAKVDTLVNACDFEFDHESLNGIPDRKGTVEKLTKKWHPDKNQMMTLKVNEGEGMINMHWLFVKLHEICFCLQDIITKTPKKKISEWKYQILFEKLLQLFGFNTLSQPFISMEKTLIMGHTCSSRADIICSRFDRQTDTPVICVCEVISENDSMPYPPMKKQKTDTEDKSLPATSPKSSIGDHALWTQHIGELLVYLQKSFRYEGILGITIEKTWVRFTHLEVPKATWRKMTERPANRPGPLKLDWEERPVFCYSDRYNYLNREDRKTIFKALMTIRKMQTEYEKTQ